MIRSSAWAAVACLALVSTLSAQDNTAQITAVKPIASNSDAQASSSPATATISDDCSPGCEGSFFQRTRTRTQWLPRRGCNQCGTDCGGGCQAAPVQDAGCCGSGGIRQLGQSFFRRDCNSDCGDGCDDGCAPACQPCSYRSIFGGWVGLEDFSTTNGQGQPVEFSFRDGYLLGMASGRYLNDCTRVEMEGAYRNNSADSATISGTVIPFDGHLNNWATMFNIYRDFKQGGALTPYAGIGAGFAYTDANLNIGGTAYTIDDWAFAYQAILGVSYQSSHNRDLFVEYRYYGNTEVEMVPAAGSTFDFDYLSHNVVFGIRFNR